MKIKLWNEILKQMYYQESVMSYDFIVSCQIFVLMNLELHSKILRLTHRQHDSTRY